MNLYIHVYYITAERMDSTRLPGPTRVRRPQLVGSRGCRSNWLWESRSRRGNLPMESSPRLRGAGVLSGTRHTGSGSEVDYDPDQYRPIASRAGPLPDLARDMRIPRDRLKRQRVFSQFVYSIHKITFRFLSTKSAQQRRVIPNTIGSEGKESNRRKWQPCQYVKI